MTRSESAAINRLIETVERNYQEARQDRAEMRNEIDRVNQKVDGLAGIMAQVRGGWWLLRWLWKAAVAVAAILAWIGFNQLSQWLHMSAKS